jgi:hypothetical protein
MPALQSKPSPAHVQFLFQKYGNNGQGDPQILINILCGSGGDTINTISRAEKSLEITQCRIQNVRRSLTATRKKLRYPL